MACTSAVMPRASGFGVPDVGLLTMSELADYARKLVSATTVPVLADGEAGFFDPPNIWRTVRSFEDAGVAGIHIEDNLGGKHTDTPAGLVEPQVMERKIRAAVDAKTDPDFTIIARSDAVWVTHDLDDCVTRLQRYVDAGADAVFAPGLTARQLHQIRSRIKVHVMVLGDLSDSHGEQYPSSTLGDYADAGADLIVLFYLTLGAASKAVSSLLAELRLNNNVRKASELYENPISFEAGMGYDDYVTRVAKYSGGKNV